MSLLAAESSTGKTYIALQTAAKAQQAGKQIVIFDSEFAIDHEFASNLGLDTSKIIYFPVKTIEQCKNAVYKFLSNVHDLGLVGQFFIVIDSLGAMISEMDYKRMEKNSDSKDMGSYAGSMKSLIKACNSLAGMTQTTIICTNHIYDDPGAMFTSLVKPMPGGKIVRYLPTTIVQLSANNVKAGDKDRKIDEEAAAGSHGEVGIEVRGLGVKNRICKPLNEAYMYISFENGLSKYYGLMDLACALGALKNVGGRIRDAETDEFYGFSKDIQFDAEFWEGFIDKLQPYIEKAWHYKTEAERRAAIKKDVEMEQEIMNED
jgi:recombination protein RecA